MIKRMLLLLVLAGASYAGLQWFVGFRAGMIKTVMGSMANPPQTVSTVKAKNEAWPSTLGAIGTFRAVDGADLALEVSGIVQKLAFDSGAEVSKGQVLLELRDADDAAKLESLKATADLDALILHRDEMQLKINAVSQATVDSDRANLRTASANAAQQQAILDEKTLRAPFAGRLGLRQVDLGQYLSAGTTIVTLQALNPIYLDFTLPQQAAHEIKVGGAIEATLDDGSERRSNGEIKAINPKVDSTSRNVQVRAMLQNADRTLLPGMFATVEISVGRAQRYVTLPQTTVVYNAYGDLVYVVGDNKAAGTTPTARQAVVTLGPTRGDQVAILSGVDPGDEVVSAGQIKLRAGTPIKVDNAIEPLADANPLPRDP